MMRNLIATVAVTLSGYLVLCPIATADQTDVDIIFTGVVPSACAVVAPTDNTAFGQDFPTETTYSENGSVLVLCNDGAQISSEGYTDMTQPTTNQESTTVQTGTNDYVTITLP